MGKHVHQKRIFKMFRERTIAYCPGLAIGLNSIKAGLFLGQLLYWYQKGYDPDWTYKTTEEMRKETGLSRKEQDTAIRICKREGFLQTKLAGVPPKRHFSLNIEKLRSWILNLPDADTLIWLNAEKLSDLPRQNITESTGRDDSQRFPVTRGSKIEKIDFRAVPESTSVP
jgi:hypothetical protein